MLGTIVRKEFLDVWRDGRFRLAGLIVGLLMVAAVLVGLFHQRTLNQQVERASEEERARWLNQDPKNPHSAAHYGVWVFKPRQAPAFIDPGIEPYVGVTTWLEAHKQNPERYRPADDATAVQRFGDLSLSVVLKLLLPLLIILLGFGTVVAERERGTLRQVLTSRVSVARLLWGKALGLGAAVALIAVPAFVISFGIFAMTSPRMLDVAAVVRFVTMGVAYLVYVGIFVLLAVAVSALARSSRVALIILVSLWAVQALLIPRSASELAARNHPLPSSLSNSLGMHAATNLFWVDTAVATRVKNAVLDGLASERGLTSREQVKVNAAGLSLVASEHVTDAAADELFGGMNARIQEQSDQRRLFAWISPLAAIDSISMALAGTDFSHHRHFSDAAERYRRQIQTILNGDLMLNGPSEPGSEDAGYELVRGRELWAQVPPFAYSAPPPSRVVIGQSGALAALFAWFAVSGVALAIAARRMSPL